MAERDLNTSYLNDREAAEFMGFSVQTLRNWRAQSRGPAYLKIGRAIRYIKEDCVNYMTGTRVVPEA